MCGRTACTLSSSNIKRACAYRDEDGVEHEPDWVDAPCGGVYKPSVNIPPTSYTPILYTPKPGGNRVLQPMLWGLVPPWFSGTNPKAHGLSTNNARLEGVQESKLYKGAVQRRCIVLCDGFYEWQREDKIKQPYLVYARQKDHDIEDVLKYSEDPDDPINEKAWNGPELLKMAGLYSVWRGQDGTPVYNYTILTRESNSVLSWLHHRMPCFLTQHQAQFWLDPLLPVHEALGLLKVPSESDLSWHTVSPEVGNVKNQSFHLLKKVDPVEKKKKENTSEASQTLMSNWLKRSNNSPSPQPLKKK